MERSTKPAPPARERFVIRVAPVAGVFAAALSTSCDDWSTVPMWAMSPPLLRFPSKNALRVWEAICRFPTGIETASSAPPAAMVNVEYSAFNPCTWKPVLGSMSRPWALTENDPSRV